MEWFSPAAPIWMRYQTTGHLFGTSLIETEIRRGPQTTRILFSGDVGRYDAPLYHDPTPPPACQYLICESTYGNREHPDQPVLDELCTVVTGALQRGGVMLFAAFAIGRAQQLIYLLRVLMESGRIAKLPIFLDSPMAINASDIYARYPEDYDLNEAPLIGSQNIFDGQHVKLTRTVDESKQINDVSGPAVIIASNGMMTGGPDPPSLRAALAARAQHHRAGGLHGRGNSWPRTGRRCKNSPHLRTRRASAGSRGLDVGAKWACRAS